MFSKNDECRVYAPTVGEQAAVVLVENMEKVEYARLLQKVGCVFQLMASIRWPVFEMGPHIIYVIFLALHMTCKLGLRAQVRRVYRLRGSETPTLPFMQHRYGN